MSKNRNCSKRTRQHQHALVVIALVFMAHLLGCGVKADPSPPESPTVIGRGKPAFRESTRGMKPVTDKNLTQEPEETEDEED